MRKQTKSHYRGKPLKMAKCGKYTQHICVHEFREHEECKDCKLVRHRYYKLYMVINGKRHRRCARCGRYKPISAFPNRYDGPHKSSWCKYCYNEYHQNLKLKNNETKSI